MGGVQNSSGNSGGGRGYFSGGGMDIFWIYTLLDFQPNVVLSLLNVNMA